MEPHKRSPRRIATLAVAVAAALMTAAPAHAASIGGFVVDGDTGLGSGPSVVTLAGAGSPAPQAQTDPSGRYLFNGIAAGSVVRVLASGPPGWVEGATGDVELPATGQIAQNVEIRRNWVSVPGGARVASTNAEAAADGCGADKALDGDHASGWSAPAGRPEADAPSVTVELPTTVDVGKVALEPAAACGHDAGAALGRFRVETSGDGVTWATAAENQLGADARGAVTAFDAEPGVTGVRFVRVVLLSAQDPAATSIDVRELQVLGAGPNQPPTGTLAADAPRNVVRGTTRLRATFSDPDSTILHYLWDFDGDGAWDQSTLGPTVAHVWAGAGTYHVTVGARDFRGALGTAALDLRISDPDAPLEAVPQRKPLIAFDPPDGPSLMARVACASKCTFTAKMTISRPMARKLHTRKLTVATLRRTLAGAGLASWTIELSPATVKRVRKAHLRKLKVRLVATAVDAQKRRTTVRRWVTLR